MQNELKSIICTDYSHLHKHFSVQEIDEIINITKSENFDVTEFCNTYLTHFSTVAQTRILCLKTDYMLNTTFNTIMCASKWKKKIRHSI